MIDTVGFKHRPRKFLGNVIFFVGNACGCQNADAVRSGLVFDLTEPLRDQIELDSMDFLDIVMELRKRYGELAISPVYRSFALGFDGPDFLNLVVGCATEQSPGEINGEIEIIHRMVGRERGEEKFSSRSLDIDLLLYDDQVIDSPPLRIRTSPALI